ncbi:MAG: hypothetical protein JWM47_4598 [Acidimicrobiales bacterium]|nr:hypothetical protein [Acidimicrobiales bacterium]
MGGISNKRAGGIVSRAVGLSGVGCGRGPKSSAMAREKVNAGEGCPVVDSAMGRDKDMNLVDRYCNSPPADAHHQPTHLYHRKCPRLTATCKVNWLWEVRHVNCWLRQRLILLGSGLQLGRCREGCGGQCNG